jgi:cytochrome c biogenesis protein CcmG/thiol:disulfide interchange protein DsbE
MLKRLLPLIGFVLLAGLLYAGIRMNERRSAEGVDPNALPSPLLGRAAPAFSLPELRNPAVRVSTDQLRGAPYLLNVWGSWCPACRIEHPLVAQLAESGRLRVVGLNYKDERDEALRWLAQFGDPYAHIPVDGDGRTGIEWGVYGAPESYLVDADGTVLFKHVGPLTPDVIERQILGRLEDATP